MVSPSWAILGALFATFRGLLDDAALVSVLVMVQTTVSPSPTRICDLPQNYLEPILLEAAGQRGSIIRFNTEFLDLVQDADGVTATVRDRVTNETYEIRAKYLVGADGELVAWAIVETREGLDNVREIAQVKGLGVLVPGAGTLGGLFSTTNAEGRRVRDDAAWEAAIQKVLAACKEFSVPCGYPVSEADIEARMQQGFTVGILQSFNDAAFRAVAKGRQIGGRN